MAGQLIYVGFRMSRAEHARLTELARLSDRSLSSVLRELVRCAQIEDLVGTRRHRRPDDTVPRCPSDDRQEEAR